MYKDGQDVEPQDETYDSSMTKDSDRATTAEAQKFTSLEEQYVQQQKQTTIKSAGCHSLGVVNAKEFIPPEFGYRPAGSRLNDYNTRGRATKCGYNSVCTFIGVIWARNYEN
ncbi:MAG: hypothetical protein EZS28_004293 [Streblomastix strix]|uniref:Uncharacterized protein n=1 Tax=Streblomastix strix TaxID=222440 RepID=A0A5J4X0P3_9EUKA|nr:MAG: hypothetical protein EZS28_004293 [Streblomastix strix]